MLGVAEVASILRCSPKTVYRLADSGKMPAPCRLGALVRWSRAAIEAWIAQGCPAHRKLAGR
jgi:excisionase family DNA binding protein